MSNFSLVDDFRDYDVACLQAIDEGKWDGSASKYTDSQYEAACALDRKGCGSKYASMPPKQRCSLPYKTPSGEVSRAGTHAAAQRIGSVTDACPSAIGSAKAALRAAYKQLGEKPPSSISGSAVPDGEGFDFTLMGASVFETEGRIWAIREEFLDALAQANGRIISADTVRAAVEARGRTGLTSVTSGGVATIPIYGLVTPKTSLLSLLFGGGGGLDMLKSQVSEAVGNPDVKAIVFDVDSPGGMIDQVPETAQVIRQARDAKPTVAVANTQCGSAAYWLASQAHEVIATPSAEVGSIGVYSLHKDMSKALQGEGINVTLVKAGKYKAEDSPFAPLTAEARDARQQTVDDFYTQFVNDVAQGRNTDAEAVMNGYGEGRSLGAKRAKSAGLVDKIATLDQTLSRMASGRARSRMTDSSAASQDEFTPEVESAEVSPEDKVRVAEVMSWLAAA